MSTHRWVSVGITALLLAAAAPAVAQNSVNDQADRLVNAWLGQDTAHNRQLARSQPLESSAVFQPQMTRQKRIYSKLPSIPHFYYKDARGPAMLAISKRGPAVRYWKGHEGKRVSFHGQVVKRSNEVRMSKVKSLAPRWLPQKLGQRVAKWRARRMMRRAVKAGVAPTPAAIERGFTSRR